MMKLFQNIKDEPALMEVLYSEFSPISPQQLLKIAARKKENSLILKMILLIKILIIQQSKICGI